MASDQPSPRVAELARDLRDTLIAFRRENGFGRGIAAPQLGVAERVIVIDAPNSAFSAALVNPEITRRSREEVLVWDSCFSLPGLVVEVRRSAAVTVEYSDLDGARRTVEAAAARERPGSDAVATTQVNMTGAANDRRLPTIAGFAAVVLWSATVALARSTAERLGPATAGLSVYLVAGVFSTACHLGKNRSFAPRQALSWKYVLGCGALFVAYTIAFFLALGLAKDRSQTVEVGLLNYLWPALTLLFSLFLLGNKGGAGLIPGTVLALGGVFLVVTQGTAPSWSAFVANLLDNPAAYGLAFFAAVTWGLYSNLARRWGPSGGGGAVHLFLLASAAAFLAARLAAPEVGTWSVRAAAEVVTLGVMTALGYLFWDLAMRAGNMVLVAAFSYLTPFLSTVVICAYLGVRPTPQLWVGCVLIVVGSYLSWRSIRSLDWANSGSRPQSVVKKEES